MLISAPPSSLHYPITITALLKQPGDDIERRAPLFSYTYTSSTVEGNRFGEERSVRKTYPAEFESEAEGRVVRWHVAVGDIVASAGTPLIEIDEPCKHEIQFAGLCVNCGKDMTEVDYATTQPNAHRATISMVHGHTALKVSQDEANRSSDASMRRLLATKKLSLVVDLDQTIIHAVCDPTVADWQKDESNPNHAAVKDVESFELMDEGPSNRPCSYYIKMRQGLKGFLERMSSKFELHIYTMGTRSYAHHVANIVDPEHKIFADRILSRDESGSMTAKNLHRLFPVDTKMVVIIDDRGDIWGWSPNLIRVQPFSFFVGIGDINSSFLPPQQDVIAPKSAPEKKEAKNEPVAEPKDAKSIEDALLQMAGDNDPSKIEEQGNKQQEEIAAQVQDRPLLREQELLDKQDEDGDKTNGSAAATPDAHRRHPLLQDDDRELEFLEDHLRSVHDAFFTEYERKLAGAVGGRVAELRPDKRAAKKARPVDDLLLVPDVKEIMPRMKSDVLAGVVVCFTGVIPQNIDPQL
jgi:RNA polymerase II subunit A-like phosphatase